MRRTPSLAKLSPGVVLAVAIAGCTSGTTTPRNVALPATVVTAQPSAVVRASAPTASSSVAPVVRGPELDVVIDEQDHPCSHGRAAANAGYLEITIDCPTTGKNPKPVQVQILLPPGPSSRFFSGLTMSPRIDLKGAGVPGYVILEPFQTRVNLGEFELARGARIRGTIEFKTRAAGGRGSFDVIYDDDPISGDPAPDAAALKLPFAGIIGVPGSSSVKSKAVPFKSKSAVVNLVNRDGIDVLRSIRLFSATGATCEKEPTGDGVEVELAASANSVSGPQPAGNVLVLSSHASGASGVSPTWYPRAWYSIDDAASDRVKGTLVVTSAVYMREVPNAPDVSYSLAVRAAGTFDAVVCRRAPDWKDHFE